MTSDDDRAPLGKDASGELAENLVHEIKDVSVAWLGELPRAPAVAVAAPEHFIRFGFVLTRDEMRRDDDGVFEARGQKRRGERRFEVVVGVRLVP
jgi:hypothetical protein